MSDTTEKLCTNCVHDAVLPSLYPCIECKNNCGKEDNWQPITLTKTARAPKLPSAPDILSAAEKHMRDRAATYDKPEGERSMSQTVVVFNAFHGTSLTEAQGWHFMQILKDVRLFTRDGYHADSAEDGVAYAGLKAEAKAKE
jgi:hypothetical protein